MPEFGEQPTVRRAVLTCAYPGNRYQSPIRGRPEIRENERNCADEPARPRSTCALPREKYRTSCSRCLPRLHRGQPSQLRPEGLPRSSAAVDSAERRLRHHGVRHCRDPARGRLGGIDALASAGRMRRRSLLCIDLSREHFSIRHARRCVRPQLGSFPRNPPAISAAARGVGIVVHRGMGGPPAPPITSSDVT